MEYKMRKWQILCLLIPVFYFAVSCRPCLSTEKSRIKKAQEEFLRSLDVVGDRMRVGKGSLDEFNQAVDILEKVTGIKGHREHQFLTDYFKPELLKPDYEKWKDWYEKNKDKLYWDEKQKKIIVKNK
jgi:hypothetical protein